METREDPGSSYSLTFSCVGYDVSETGCPIDTGTTPAFSEGGPSYLEAEHISFEDRI